MALPVTPTIGLGEANRRKKDKKLTHALYQEATKRVDGIRFIAVPQQVEYQGALRILEGDPLQRKLCVNNTARLQRT